MTKPWKAALAKAIAATRKVIAATTVVASCFVGVDMKAEAKEDDAEEAEEEDEVEADERQEDGGAARVVADGCVGLG